MSTVRIYGVSDRIPSKYRRFHYCAFFPWDVSNARGGVKLLPLYFSDAQFYAHTPEKLLQDRAHLLDVMEGASSRLCLMGPKGVYKNIYVVETRDDLLSQTQALASNDKTARKQAKKAQRSNPERAFVLALLKYNVPIHNQLDDGTTQQGFMPVTSPQVLSLLGGCDEVWEKSTGLTLWKTGNAWPLIPAIMMGGSVKKMEQPPICSFGNIVSLHSPHTWVKNVASSFLALGDGIFPSPNFH